MIDTYPSNNIKRDELKKCISAIKSLNIDILVTSHLPLELEIQEMADYFIYDKNNPLVKEHTKLWSFQDHFYFEIYYDYHAPAICLSMFNGFNFAKLHKYDFVVYLSSDYIFSDIDLDKMKSLLSRCESEKKKGFVFNPQDWQVTRCSDGESGNYLWETAMFGFDVETFLEFFNPPSTLYEYNQLECVEKSLEIIFYHKMIHLKEDLVVIPFSSDGYFLDSLVNMSSKTSFVCELIRNKSNPETFIFIFSSHSRAYDSLVKIYLSNTPIFEQHFPAETWYYNQFNITNQELRVEVYQENELIKLKNYTLDQNLLDNINNNRSFFEHI